MVGKELQDHQVQAVTDPQPRALRAVGTSRDGDPNLPGQLQGLSWEIPAGGGVTNSKCDSSSCHIQDLEEGENLPHPGCRTNADQLQQSKRG